MKKKQIGTVATIFSIKSYALNLTKKKKKYFQEPVAGESINRPVRVQVDGPDITLSTTIPPSLLYSILAPSHAHSYSCIPPSSHTTQWYSQIILQIKKKKKNQQKKIPKATKVGGGGGKALLAQPLVEELFFFAASLISEKKI